MVININFMSKTENEHVVSLHTKKFFTQVLLKTDFTEIIKLLIYYNSLMNVFHLPNCCSYQKCPQTALKY